MPRNIPVPPISCPLQAARLFHQQTSPPTPDARGMVHDAPTERPHLEKGGRDAYNAFNPLNALSPPIPMAGDLTTAPQTTAWRKCNAGYHRRGIASRVPSRQGTRELLGSQLQLTTRGGSPTLFFPLPSTHGRRDRIPDARPHTGEWESPTPDAPSPNAGVHVGLAP